MTAALEVANLTVSYDGFLALDDVSVSVEQAKVLWAGR